MQFRELEIVVVVVVVVVAGNAKASSNCPKSASLRDGHVTLQ